MEAKDVKSNEEYIPKNLDPKPDMEYIIMNDIDYDYVYITCDTALKGGMKHDGTAYCVWGMKTKLVSAQTRQGYTTLIENITLLFLSVIIIDFILIFITSF